ncbi:MAG: MarR family transcriptional regulator [Caulobacteraceae bacterium]|nr:MarR family winged helix-turn-helix transcriptional regulator [Caulobacter sp.]RYF95395.1 MAG: MarR family transcriptional regulator [Caulobacteraceae bacterium]
MTRAAITFEDTHHIRDSCLCLHAQRAARVLARRFDEALRPVGLTNSQFSLLNALNRPGSAGIGQVASLLGADRTTLTAALKPLERDGLTRTEIDPADHRARRIALTAAGHARLSAALPLWTALHARLEAELEAEQPAQLRRGLSALAAPAPPVCDASENA